MKLRLIAWLVFALGTVLVRSGYLDNVIYNIDEAEYAVAADGMDHGWLTGVDLLGSTKPPGIAVLYNLLFHLFGRSMAVIHIAHLIIVIVTGLILIELGIALWGLAAAIPTAVLFWMIGNGFHLPSETLALNVESAGMLFALLALYLTWTRSGTRWAILTAGLCLGLAVMFRQSILFLSVPVIAALLIRKVRRWSVYALLSLGFLLPWIAVFIVYARAGGLSWAWDSWVRYPATYSSDLGVLGFFVALYRNHKEFLQQSFVSVGLAVWGGVALKRMKMQSEFVFLWTLLIASYLALCTGSRFYGHYFIQVYPAIALFGVPAWLSIPEATKRVRIIWILALCVGGIHTALHFPFFERMHRGRGAPEVLYSIGMEKEEYAVAQFAREHTTADQTIVVWGYCPQIYYLADRLPGVRDFLCHYITGYSPGSFDPRYERAPRPYSRPDAETLFIEDLKTRQPKYIFDLVQKRDYMFDFFKYSLRTYRQLSDYLRTNYLPEGEINGVLIYRLRTPDDTWWPDSTESK